MGATPAWATLALTLPDADAQWVGQFADGFAALAGEFKLALVGGDTTRGPLSVTVTVHGFVPDGAALLRSGARAGDGVYVTGTLGDAAAGLRILAQGEGAPGNDRPTTSRTILIERLDRPTPRVAQGLALRGRASACIDISDGLVADLGHVCAASGVGAEIDVESLPASSALFGLCDAPTRHALQLAGGDDYELCFTAADAEAASLLGDLARGGCGATRVGRIVAGYGVNIRDAGGNPVAVMRPGWDHFR
jgi:thiamine-monophosphate kinase